MSSDAVAVGAFDLLDDTMSAKHAEEACHLAVSFFR